VREKERERFPVGKVNEENEDSVKERKGADSERRGETEGANVK
jgi:hypothetical protein